MIIGARRIKDLIRNQAKGDSSKSQMLFRHFAMERFLERLSVSEYRDDFVIKGGILISSLIGINERTTRDIDATMRRHAMNRSNVAQIIGEITHIELGDGYSFELGEPVDIMEDSEYGGVRIPVKAIIERSKIDFKIDISTGDAITPQAIEYRYKLMFEDRAIPLRSYNVETALAEKLETILSLADQSTRMRDFYDIWVLVESERKIDYELLRSALEATMMVRKGEVFIETGNQAVDVLEKSTIMREQWNRYQIASPFSSSIGWDDTLRVLRMILNKIATQ